jgi:uncharacterized protein (DUF2249 family)
MPTADTPKEIASIKPAKINELDVRPILKAGGEPFSVIMAAIGNTAGDGALRLRATFKPAPLFHVLGKQGWDHWIEHGEADDWIVWFYRGQNGKPKQGLGQADVSAALLQKESPELQKRLKVEGSTWLLDVRTLSPPEPMELTLSVLEKLPQGVSLVQVNERVPQFLLPILLERGFRYEVTQSSADGKDVVRVEIGRAS